MKKSDIERLRELELEKNKRILQRMIAKEDLYITALDYNDEIVIIRSKIIEMSDTGIIVVINPDRAEKDGEKFQLLDLVALKMVIFTLAESEEEILELLEIMEEPEKADSDFYQP